MDASKAKGGPSVLSLVQIAMPSLSNRQSQLPGRYHRQRLERVEVPGPDGHGYRRTASPILCCLLAALLSSIGCSRGTNTASDPRAEASDELLRAEPGGLTGDPIAEPYLTDLNPTVVKPVVMRFGDGTMLVQSPGSDQVEVIPAPEPDPKPTNKAEMRTTKREVIPAPQPDGVAGIESQPNNSAVPPKLKQLDPEPATNQTGAPPNYRQWAVPDATLVVTGRQHGYIEPCGCTGLDRQKGGMARRFTLLDELKELGWNLVPVDAGDQVRRFGPQAEIKLQQTARALRQMNYQAVGFGPDDLQLGVGELLSVAAAQAQDDAMYVSANVVLMDASLMPQTKVVDAGGQRIGVTSILDPESLVAKPGAEITVSPIVGAAHSAIKKLQSQNTDFNLLLYFGKEESAQALVREVPGFDLVAAAGSYGEPTYKPLPIEGSQTQMIVTGDKGMYAGLVGIYADRPMNYARVPLTHEFADAPEMRQLMMEYQHQLKALGLDGLGLLPPVPHASGQAFVGTHVCGECHTTAMAIWEGSRHAEATADIIKPPKERGDIARHFDPECLSCHVTGWNPQEYFPYASGYLSLEKSEHLVGNGCENCHGPGSQHAAAELGDIDVSDEIRDQYRSAMRLPLEKARDKCLECHDLDNSPDFHEEDAFEDIYWPEVEHYGVD